MSLQHSSTWAILHETLSESIMLHSNQDFHCILVTMYSEEGHFSQSLALLIVHLLYIISVYTLHLFCCRWVGKYCLFAVLCLHAGSLQVSPPPMPLPLAEHPVQVHKIVPVCAQSDLCCQLLPREMLRHRLHWTSGPLRSKEPCLLQSYRAHSYRSGRRSLHWMRRMR